MSDVNTIKDRIIDKIDALSSVQVVYPAHHVNPSGWPAVFVRTTDLQGEFSSNAENSRVYAFEITMAMSIGQDMVSEAERERLDYSERVLNDVLDQIITAFDTDFTLDDTPVLFVEAADATWGYLSGEFGEAQALQCTLRIYTEKVVV